MPGAVVSEIAPMALRPSDCSGGAVKSIEGSPFARVIVETSDGPITPNWMSTGRALGSRAAQIQRWGHRSSAR